MRRAYVAGRFGDWRLVRRAQDALRRSGYEISYDWTTHAEPTGAREAEHAGTLAVDVQRRAAERDLRGATVADRFVLICVGEMEQALGCFVELGAAFASGTTRVDVVAPHRGSIFWHLRGVQTYSDVAAWEAALRDEDE